MTNTFLNGVKSSGNELSRCDCSPQPTRNDSVFSVSASSYYRGTIIVISPIDTPYELLAQIQDRPLRFRISRTDGTKNGRRESYQERVKRVMFPPDVARPFYDEFTGSFVRSGRMGRRARIYKLSTFSSCTLDLSILITWSIVQFSISSFSDESQSPTSNRSPQA